MKRGEKEEQKQNMKPGKYLTMKVILIVMVTKRKGFKIVIFWLWVDYQFDIYQNNPIKILFIIIHGYANMAINYKSKFGKKCV